MKRSFLGLIAAALFAILGPVPIASAHDWWWWHHSSPKPAGVGADSKYKHTKSAKAPQMSKPIALFTTPKSIGFWHKSPGPMGAGGELVAQSKLAHSNAAPQASAQAPAQSSAAAVSESAAPAQPAAPSSTPAQPVPAESSAQVPAPVQASASAPAAQPVSASELTQQASAQDGTVPVHQHHNFFSFAWLHHKHNQPPAAAPAPATAKDSTTTAATSDQ